MIYQTDSSLETPALDPALFPLNPDVVFLNHGSFGCCPLAVLEFQHKLRLRMERQLVQFLQVELEGLLDEARSSLAKFVRVDADDLVFVSNATSGVNTVLRSLSFKPGDELLVTNQEYNACRNALNFAAERDGAKVVTISLPFPVGASKEITDIVLSHVTDKTRLILIDHVTSPTGIILPLADIIPAMNARGIETLVDGAHAPGMIPLDIKALQPTYYTGNCHKWMCAPKSAGFLYVHKDKQSLIRPLSISHGANSLRNDRSRFQIEFAWMGTRDPTAILSVSESLDYLSKSVPGGWPQLMERNHSLAVSARSILCEVLGIPSPCPDGMVGSMASIPIPDSTEPPLSLFPIQMDSWKLELLKKHSIEVPFVPWPAYPRRMVRISAQLYNSLPQYRLLAGALQDLSGGR